MVLLATLPVALRLALLPRAPVPIPATADDTSYVLLADTLAHFRLANPPHPFARFFETNFVLQDPTYSSIFPLGQGIALAIGELVFGHPWAGVLLSEAIFCALCYWMLRAWISPGWAFAGGLVAVMQFGPLSYWMNSYWGGAVSGIAGCLVFGAVPRKNGWLIGIGIGLELLTRPYECLLLVLGIVGGWALTRAKLELRMIVATAISALPAVALTFAHNHAVTGGWTTLPYQLSRYQYGSPTTFTFESNPSPHRDLSQEQRDNYEVQSIVHNREARVNFIPRLVNRTRYFRFFFLPPLYLACGAFLFTLRDQRMRSLLIPVGLLVVGTNLYPYFYTHYIAAISGVFLLMSVAGLEMLWRWSESAAVLVFLLAVSHFVFWYGLHLTGSEETVAAMLPYETSDYLNRGDPEGRVPVLKRLGEAPGKQLVFVRFGPVHPLSEWIGNAAIIDNSRVVWALDLGRTENEKLKQYYGDRTVWLVEPDDKPPRLQSYPEKPGLHFESP
jgi:hypothetical protein